MKEEATSRKPEETPKNQNNDQNPWRIFSFVETTKSFQLSRLAEVTKLLNHYKSKNREKLSGGNFRKLDEKLYTCPGKEALDYYFNGMEIQACLFDMYHTGYQQQMTNWPELPVNSIIVSKLFSSCRCGDARIANNKVFSFDLVSKDPSVIASCDMSNTPLESSSVDVAVFVFHQWEQTIQVTSKRHIEFFVQVVGFSKKQV
uniref:Ribosomal RNA-processing protein 8 n=2 Tax=Brassica oleracea TaxID=3712 RepID=A0A0D2ZSB2_BRAOL|nr:unnamed protein product [Brassica oleracea]